MKQVEVLRNKEDGQLTVAYNGIDLDNYNYLKVKEFIEEVENADMWSDIDAEVYEEALAEYDLDYSSYDDPDAMWSDFLKEAESDK